MTYRRRIDDTRLSEASLIMGLGFYPLIIIYIYITQRPFSRLLFKLAELLLFASLGILAFLSLRYSIIYGGP